MTGFESYPTPVLIGVRDNLLSSMEKFATMSDEDLTRSVPKGAPRIAFVPITVMIFEMIQETLDNRGEG